MEEITKVYVVHKTHLDIGFTDFSKSVLEGYVKNFIPKAIDTAYEVNTREKPKQFVWTVGAYLIKYYMQHADDAGVKKLTEAINDGYVDWHLIPCTTHTELMDADLFCYGINMGKELDKKFGKNHFAAKMTDVPGHTHAMVPYLKKYGIQYIHIGINASSRPLDVPVLCLIKYGDSEVILNYAKDYGQACVFKHVALEFAHTADNVGPPNASKIKEEMKRLKDKYPKAEIISSGLEGFAAEILPFKNELPVIAKELGDTWIHGVATDPYKTAMLCELKRIRKQWILEQPSDIYSTEYDVFMENLLLICEHTCGLDSKKHLYDYKNWDKNDFLNARIMDKTDSANLEAGGTVIKQFTLREYSLSGSNIQGGSYSKLEQSWQEQREYLVNAIQVLPNKYKSVILTKQKELCPSIQSAVSNKSSNRIFVVNGWKIMVNKDGSLTVKSKDGKKFDNTILGILKYETFDSEIVYECYGNYNRNFEKEGEWAEPDFSKPGLSRANTAKTTEFEFQENGVMLNGDKLNITLLSVDEAHRIYGCPKIAEIAYRFLKQTIEISVKWFEKDMNKMPEATFFGFQFDNYDNLIISKLGLPIEPFNIIDGGNKKIHAIEYVSAKNFSVYPKHSPLLSIGGRHLYDTNDSYGNISDGLHFILHNNRWNTNFPLWYGQNASFDFCVTLI